MLTKLYNWLTTTDAYKWGAVLWVLLMPIRPAMAAAIILPMADLLLAIVVSIKSPQNTLPWYKWYQIVRSAGIKRTIGKVCLYLSGVTLAFVAETYLTGPVVPCIHLVTCLIGVTELKSCLEHLDDLHGAPVFSSVLNSIAPPQPSIQPPPQEPPAGSGK